MKIIEYELHIIDSQMTPSLHTHAETHIRVQIHLYVCVFLFFSVRICVRISFLSSRSVILFFNYKQQLIYSCIKETCIHLCESMHVCRKY